MNLRAPNGWTSYGHQQEAYTSADGAVYWSGFFFITGAPKDRNQFGWYVVRQGATSAFIAKEKAESGQLTYQPGVGLSVAYALPDGSRFYEPVPGFVDGAPHSSPTPTPAPQPGGLDQEARNQAAAALSRANQAYERADLGVRWSQDNEGRLSSVVAALGGKVTAQEATEIAWNKSGDRIADWWNRMVRYETPQLFNILWNRTRKIMIAAKVPGAEALPVNRDETLFM